jgi:hypothetical protein
VTAGSQEKRAPSRRLRRATVAALVATGLVSSSVLMPGLAAAAVPTFPDNLVVFPDRDFITIEGYQDHVGEEALVEVKRAGQVVGSAKGKVEAGDVAFEINHPGGYCWGAGTGVNVTPDIQPGDQVFISFASGGPAGDTTVQDAFVDTDSVLDEATRTLTITGHIADGVDQAQTEQRIVNPELKDTDIGRRDVRAVPGGIAASPGYASDLEFLPAATDDPATPINETAGPRFKATYIFDTLETARLAAGGGGERFMSWQLEDNDANRQGLTIAEYGELGGPGMGGCPAGPADVAPAKGNAGFALATDKKSMKVTWTPAEPVPGTPAITGYDVSVLGAAVNGVQPEIGARTGAGATSATISGLNDTASYTVEVRSLAGTKAGEPFPVKASASGGGATGDTTAPKLTATPAGQASSVTLSSDDTAASIYFVTYPTPTPPTDPNAPVPATPQVIDVVNGLPTEEAKLYTAPIAITGPTTVKFAAFDAAGNYDTGQADYTLATATAPGAPTVPVATGGMTSASLRWTAPTGTVTGYGVQLHSVETPTVPAGPVGELRETTTADPTLALTGLTPGDYTFTVKAKNSAGYGVESVKSAKFTVAVVSARITVLAGTWRTGDLRINGSTDQPAAAGSIRFYKAKADGTADTAAPVGGTVPQGLTAAAPPATGSTFNARYNTAATAGATNPGRIVAVLTSAGANPRVLGTSPVFTVTNK